MKTRRQRRRNTRRRRQRGGNVSDLVRHVTEVCKKNPEGETFCLENMENVIDYYTSKGKTFQTGTKLPEDWKDLSVVVVRMHVTDVDARHGFALVREGSTWFRADSWQGIHRFTATPIDIDAWLQTWREFTDRLASGSYDRDDFVRLFGDWPAEKEALRAEGLWINDYPRSRAGVFVLKLKVWTA